MTVSDEKAPNLNFFDAANAADLHPVFKEIRARCRLPSLSEAIRAIHFPDSPEEVEAARHRLAFDELFGLQLHLGGLQREREARPGRLSPITSLGWSANSQRIPLASSCSD